MPWFPDFAGAVERARLETRAAGHADPVAEYCKLLRTGDTGALEAAWPGDVTIYDPLAGVIRGHKEIRHFVRSNASWLGTLSARTETLASTVAGTRIVVELMAQVSDGGQELAWPVALVCESPDDRSVVFRTYCRAWPITGPHHLRPAILEPGEVHPGDVVGRYAAALRAGDTEAAVAAFEPDGYVREASVGPQHTHRGTSALGAFFAWQFSAGGGIELEDCAVTDDGTRCAIEYTCARWGSHQLAPQAGLTVCERGSGGLLAAVRVYDDIAAPVEELP